MNIFVLDNDIEKCVQYHCDQHVVKMITESTQMLSTACRLSGQDCGYRIAHKNHPCTIWTRTSVDNWKWLLKLTELLNEEYKYRYQKTDNHKAYDMAKTLSEPDLVDQGLTPHPICMPEEYKTEHCVESYRNFYNYDKSRFATWKRREAPLWFERFADVAA